MWVLVWNYDSVKVVLFLGIEIMVGDLLELEIIKVAIVGCIVVINVVGVRFSVDLIGFFKVDYLGICNLVDIVKVNGIE